MRITDEITAYILNRMEETDTGFAELQRNILAQELGCVPSQINYVLTSRFTPEQGYLVESRRGGGGYIRISRIHWQNDMAPLMHVVNSIGECLTPAVAQSILDNLYYRQILSAEAYHLIGTALADQSYRAVPVEQRDSLRASMMKQMLTTLTM